MPSGVAPVVVLEPDGAAIAAAKIFGLLDKRVKEKVEEYQEMARKNLEKDDEEVGYD
jgi:phosphoribosylcarboxyaminoimidazole (NCAIR) mutase